MNYVIVAYELCKIKPCPIKPVDKFEDSTLKILYNRNTCCALATTYQDAAWHFIHNCFVRFPGTDSQNRSRACALGSYS